LTETPRENTLVNSGIKSRSVLLVDAEGTSLGVKSTREALELAHSSGLDLVIVSPNVDPPVAKIMDYGKYKYEQSKAKSKGDAANRKSGSVKVVQLTVNIGDHDLQTKLRHTREFLAEGDRVRFILKFKGRETSHRELGAAVLQRVIEALSDVAKVEQQPKMETGRDMTMAVAPK
jgi:translation initiation factor IF-3